MFPFPALPSARTRSKKTLVPSGAKTASTSPLKPLRIVLRIASCSAIVPYWPKKAVTLPAFCVETGRRPARSGEAAERERGPDAAGRGQRRPPVD